VNGHLAGFLETLVSTVLVLVFDILVPDEISERFCEKLGQPTQILYIATRAWQSRPSPVTKETRTEFALWCSAVAKSDNKEKPDERYNAMHRQ